MKPLSLCILGGTGFLGTRLVARLIKDNYRVTVLSRDRELLCDCNRFHGESLTLLNHVL